MITCGWCGVHYPQWQSQCSHCGGDLPPKDNGLGPPPKPPPRKLPRGFAIRQWVTANFGVVFGLIFFIVGAVITSAFVWSKTWLALLPGFFAISGFFMLLRGISQARSTLRAFREGEAAEGFYLSIEKDPLYAGHKGPSPWIVKYAFHAEGKRFEGTFSTSDGNIRALAQVNKPVWVLYVKDDPTQNTIYPPLK